jgi:hypothetical protein
LTSSDRVTDVFYGVFIGHFDDDQVTSKLVYPKLEVVGVPMDMVLNDS